MTPAIPPGPTSILSLFESLEYILDENEKLSDVFSRKQFGASLKDLSWVWCHFIVAHRLLCSIAVHV